MINKFRKQLIFLIIGLLFGLTIAPIISGSVYHSSNSSNTNGDNLEILWEIEGHTRSVYGVAFSQDGQTVASGADYSDSSAKLWRASDGTLLHTYPYNDDSVLSVDISSDNQFLAAGYIVTDYPPGGKMNLWDISSETIVNDFGG